jgi:transposase InsO family protein
MWDALENRHRPRNQSSRFSTLVDLLGTRGETWKVLYEKIDHLAYQFMDLLTPGFSVTDLIGELKLFALIRNISPELNIRNQILASPNANYRLAVDTITSHNSTSPSAQQIVPATSAASANTAVTTTAYVARGSASGSKPKHGSPCPFCIVHNHPFSQCNNVKLYAKVYQHDRANNIRRDGNGAPKTYDNNRRVGRDTANTTGDVNSFHYPGTSTHEFAEKASSFRNHPRTPTDRWILDSGATKHMTSRKDWLMGLIPDKRPIEVADGMVIWSTGIGYVNLIASNGAAFRLDCVLLVPDLKSNLISLTFLSVYQRYKIVFIGFVITCTKSGNSLTASITLNGVPVANCTVQLPENAGSAITSSAPATLELWHERLAHKNFPLLVKMSNSPAVKDFKVIRSTNDVKNCTCEACIEGKSHRAPHTTTPATSKATRPLQRISTDVHGPIDIGSRKGHKYWISFLDQYSGLAAVYFMKDKSEATHYVKTFVEWAERAIPHKVSILRDDKGGEYTSNELSSYLQSKGIKRERTIRDSPEQNGQAERFNQSLQQGITTLLSRAALPPSSWADAAATFVHVHNRVPSESRNFKSPFHLFFRSIPSIAHLRPWGCLAYVHLQKDQRASHFSPRAQRCVFLRYADEAKGWVFWNTEKRSEVISDSAVFIEDNFPGTLLGKIPKVAQLPSADSFDFPEFPFDDQLLPIQPLTPAPPASSASPSVIPIPPSVSVPPASIPLPPSPQLQPDLPIPDDSSIQSATSNSLLIPPPAPLAPPPPLALPSSSTGVRLVTRIPGREGRELMREFETNRLPREVRGLIDGRHFESRTADLPAKRNNRDSANPAITISVADADGEDDLLPVNSTTAPVNTTPPSVPASPEPTTPSVPRSTPDSASTIFRRRNPATRPSSIPRNAYSRPIPPILHDDLEVPLANAVDLALHVSTNIEPKSLQDALKRPDKDQYIQAAIDEIDAHMENGTWRLRQLPHGRKAIGSRWVFKVKRDADGKVERYKARLVAKGYAQRPGVDFDETFAPTARFAALRSVIALAAVNDLELESVDISTAFLNGEIDAEVFMEIPEGLGVENGRGDKWVLELLKGLYGIKQGPRIWSKKLHKELDDMGFVRLDCDHSVFVYERDGTKLIIPVHVDDLIIASKSKSAISEFKHELAKRFKLKDNGPTSFFLGVKLTRDRASRTISLSQPAYIQSILDEFSGAGPDGVFNSAITPMGDGQILSEKDCPTTDEEKADMKDVPYRAVIGKLLYLSIATRPDIAYAVSVLCRFLQNPGRTHWNAAKRVLRYLKGTKDLKLIYSPHNTSHPPITSTVPFYTYSDADHGGNPDNSRSTGGFVSLVGGGAVHWSSRLHRQVSLSSTEAEYVAGSMAGQEIIWMRYLFEELGFSNDKASLLFMDSNSAIQVAKNPEHQSTMKHVHRYYHWVRERVNGGEIQIIHTPGNDNVADIFTKPLHKSKFLHFRPLLGLHD